MKAAVFKRAGQALSIETIADPTPAPGEVVLKVGRCGICGTDLHMTAGHDYSAPEGTVLGHEFSGEVVALGPDVDNLKLGDRVAAMPTAGCGNCAMCREGRFYWCAGFAWRAGAYAEYALAGSRQCLKLPDILTMADGALVEPLAVGLHAVRMADITPASRVLVIGAGPIGLAACYWARRLGARNVVVCAASARRAGLPAPMGASGFVVNDGLAAENANRLLGGPVDLVIEAVGLPGMIARAIELVRPRGTVVSAGHCLVPDTFNPLLATLKEVRLLFAILYSLDDFQKAIDAMDAGHVEPRTMVTQTVSSAEFPTAFEALRLPNAQCKVMFDPGL